MPSGRCLSEEMDGAVAGTSSSLSATVGCTMKGTGCDCAADVGSTTEETGCGGVVLAPRPLEELMTCPVPSTRPVVHV